MKFRQLKKLLENNDIDGIKRIVTPKTVGDKNILGDSVLQYVCMYGPDEPELFLHIVNLGAPIESELTLLHNLVASHKPRTLRTALDLGFVLANIDYETGNKKTALVLAFQTNEIKCAKILMDAGSKSRSYNTIPYWAPYFLISRNKVREASIAILCLAKRKSKILGQHNRNDVLRIIARCIWATRACV